MRSHERELQVGAAAESQLKPSVEELIEGDRSAETFDASCRSFLSSPKRGKFGSYSIR